MTNNKDVDAFKMLQPVIGKLKRKQEGELKKRLTVKVVREGNLILNKDLVEWMNFVITDQLDEAKQDLFEQLHKVSITNPLIVDELIELRLRFKKWFGSDSP
jgi:hypothetical protein